MAEHSELVVKSMTSWLTRWVNGIAASADGRAESLQMNWGGATLEVDASGTVAALVTAVS